jgi:hypothetical protein
LKLLIEDRGCIVLSRDGNNGTGQEVLCPRERLSDAIEALRGKGIEASVVAEHADYIFGEANAVMARLRTALKK